MFSTVSREINWGRPVNRAVLLSTMLKSGHVGLLQGHAAGKGRFWIVKMEESQRLRCLLTAASSWQLEKMAPLLSRYLLQQ